MLYTMSYTDHISDSADKSQKTPYSTLLVLRLGSSGLETKPQEADISQPDTPRSRLAIVERVARVMPC